MLSTIAASSRRLLSSDVVSIREAVRQVKFMNVSCHDETVNLAMALNVDPRKPNQSVYGSSRLPHGLGKTIVVAVFARGTAAQEAVAAGADFVGDDDLVDKIMKNEINFDRCICTPDMLGVVGKVARLLGPRGLMPNVKLGTVSKEIDAAVRAAKQGQVEFRAEKQGIVHAPLAKCSFTVEKIEGNLITLVESIISARPSGAKGTFVKSAVLTANKGHAVKLDVSKQPFTIRTKGRR